MCWTSDGAPLAFHQLQDQRREDQLHRQIHLAALDDDRIGPRHETVVDHRQQIGEVDAPRIAKRITTIDSSGVGISAR